MFSKIKNLQSIAFFQCVFCCVLLLYHTCVGLSTKIFIFLQKRLERSFSEHILLYIIYSYYILCIFAQKHYMVFLVKKPYLI